MADKEIKLCPLAGYDTATLPEGHVLLAVEFVRSERERLLRKTTTLRLAMTAAQADELAKALQTGAEKSRLRHSAESSRH